MAAITVEGVSKVLSGGRLALRASGSAGPGRAGAPTLVEDERALAGAPGGGVRALDGVDLAVRDGETLAVIGPSGCGKSTLLRVVAGLEAPDAGRVRYDGRDMLGVPPGGRGIGMVFQNYALYPHMESRGNLGFFLRLRHREQEIDERVRLTAEIMGLGFAELLDRKPKTLSGGQQQRVAIGRCISRDPKLFLLDEPLSNLDARLRARTRVELKRLLTRFKITTLYVTHDQSEAIALATRIAVMRGGRIEQVGPYEELYARPASAFVAGFVGRPPANLLPGALRDGQIAVLGGALPLPEPLRPVLGPGAPLLAGVRPEHVRLLAELPGSPGAPAPSGETGVLEGTVEVVEPLVAERAQLVHVALGDPGPRAAPILGDPGGASLTVRLPPEALVYRGERVLLAVEAGDVLVFDPAGERNLLL